VADCTVRRPAGRIPRSFIRQYRDGAAARGLCAISGADARKAAARQRRITPGSPRPKRRTWLTARARPTSSYVGHPALTGPACGCSKSLPAILSNPTTSSRGWRPWCPNRGSTSHAYAEICIGASIPTSGLCGVFSAAPFPEQSQRSSNCA